MGKRNVSKRPNEWAARGFGGKQDNVTPRITPQPTDQEPPTTSVNNEETTVVEPCKTKKKQMSSSNVQPKRPLKILSKTKKTTEPEETSFSEPSSNTSGTKNEIATPSEELKTKTPGKRKKAKQKSYTLFIGNLSYDTTREDIFAHFNKCGFIKEVRVPLSKEDNSSRGFAYLEVEDNVTYEKVLSMHHSFLKKRRINVECTFGGSNGSTRRKALIKDKTLKLRFLVKEGRISSVKQKQWGKPKEKS